MPGRPTDARLPRGTEPAGLPGPFGHRHQLHAAFVRFLRDAALPTGRVEAWERNDRARAFCARHGRQPDGHRRPGPAGACYVRMRLDPDAP
ncbi:hypothetical protein [Streptomyces sp. TM32]|uniref:hypothetical protein n=1 Tax=Streptomyces sp. TM32 TaxID=1652669 RepID=UPI001C205833|nr:hypothetical protein [Streptomyces sp. TM32]